MSLTINLPTVIEQQFQKEAASKGLSLDSYVVQVLRQVAFLSQKESTTELLSEAELLKKINLGISEKEWTTYRHLVQLRRAEKLTEQEHKELIDLGDRIEQANVRRLQYLVTLSKMRGVSLQKLMADLDIKPVEI